MLRCNVNSSPKSPWSVGLAATRCHLYRIAGGGGMTVTLEEFGRSEIEELLQAWIKVSQAKMKTTVDISQPSTKKDEPQSVRSLGLGNSSS